MSPILTPVSKRIEWAAPKHENDTNMASVCEREVIMNVFIVKAHPEPASFSGAMAETAVETLTTAGHTVVVSDLYEMAFNPVSGRHNFTSVRDAGYFKQQIEEVHATEVDGFAPDIQVEMDKLLGCDALILLFPLWWFGLPAILKGWVDRVFAMGKIYGGGRWYDNGVLAGKRAMLALTTGGPAPAYAERGINGDIDHILFPINHGMLRFTGFDVLPPFIAWSVAHVDDAGRADYLRQYKERLMALNTTPPIDYPSLNDYDPNTLQLK